jgi:hypothetical protein
MKGRQEAGRDFSKNCFHAYYCLFKKLKKLKKDKGIKIPAIEDLNKLTTIS